MRRQQPSLLVTSGKTNRNKLPIQRAEKQLQFVESDINEIHILLGGRRLHHFVLPDEIENEKNVNTVMFFHALENRAENNAKREMTDISGGEEKMKKITATIRRIE